MKFTNKALNQLKKRWSEHSQKH